MTINVSFIHNVRMHARKTYGFHSLMKEKTKSDITKKELFRFCDDVTQESIEYILGNVEAVLKDQELKKAMHRKVFYLMVESLQNVYNHTCKSGPKSCKPTIILYVIENDFFIETSNLIPNQEIIEIVSKIDSINSLTQEELKARYKEVLNNNIISKRGGAGLGLIDIARKSKNKIQYNHVAYTDTESILTLTIQIKSDTDLPIKKVSEKTIVLTNTSLRLYPSVSQTKHTPSISINADKHEVLIKGKSLPINASKFFSPLMQWLNDYAFSSGGKLKLIFHLEYFNTPSSFKISDILSILEKEAKNGKEIQVEWRYDQDDSDILESGKEFEHIFDLDFTFNEILDEEYDSIYNS